MQHNTENTQDNFLSKKNELPQVGFELTTLCHWATEEAQMARAQITNTTQGKVSQ